jgi:hypothetical protein
MKKGLFIVFTLGLFICSEGAIRETNANAGPITALGFVTLYGTQWIKITCNPIPVGGINTCGSFVIPWDSEDPARSVAIWSSFQRALADPSQTLQLSAIEDLTISCEWRLHGWTLKK